MVSLPRVRTCCCHCNSNKAKEHRSLPYARIRLIVSQELYLLERADKREVGGDGLVLLPANVSVVVAVVFVKYRLHKLVDALRSIRADRDETPCCEAGDGRLIFVGV